MAFTLHEATTAAEFVAVVKVESESYSKPPNTFWEIIKGASLEECASRQALWNDRDPSSHWIYAKDAETDEIVGAMNWNIHEQNPYANGGEGRPVYWWPEDPMKTLAQRFLDPFFANRPAFMNKPHLPRRHEGIGNFMIAWGLKKADQMDAETFVESAPDGVGFYKVHGFENVKDLVLDPVVEESESEELVALREKMVKKRLLPFRVDFMVRPAGVILA